MFLGRMPLFSVADVDEWARGERSVSRFRVALAFSALFAFVIGGGRSPLTAAAPLIVFTYAVAAIAQAMSPRQAAAGAPSRVLASHAFDIAAAASLALLTAGAQGPNAVFLAFPLLTAAYRWGLVETLLSAAAEIIALGAESAVGIGPAPLSEYTSGAWLHTTIAGAVYLAIGGIGVGYLGDLQRQRRREWSVLADVNRSASVEAGLSATLHGVLLAFARTFRARRALLTVRDVATSQIFLVDVQRNPDAPRGYSMVSSELEGDAASVYLFEGAGDCWYAAPRLRSDVRAVTAIDTAGRLVRNAATCLPESFTARHPFQRFLAVSINVEPEWQGRLLLFDPGVGGDPYDILTFAQRVERQIAPTIRQVSVVDRLRRSTAMVERQRLARELHDGPIQTLHAAVLQLQVMSAAGRLGASPNASEVRALETILRDEIANLRDMTHEMRLSPIETDSPHFVRDAAAIVDRYGRQHGIEARFVSAVDSVSIPAAARHEVLRILREALVNVRKHSQARQVLVSLRLAGDRLVLTIEDNGRGFAFEGRRTHREVLSTREGPLVISERIAALGGDLIVESNQGMGARLEVRVPVSPVPALAVFH